MGIKVYYSEISAQKEVKKRQQKVMMILESKLIPYEAIDITEPGKEESKDFMLTNAKPRGDSKCVTSPQVFNDDVYCGDYDDFELANENDELEQFLNIEKAVKPTVTNGNAVNGASRESSAEAEAKKANGIEAEAVPAVTEEIPPVPAETEGDEEPMSTTEEAPVKESPAPAEEEGIEDFQEIVAEEEEEEEEEA